MDGETMSTVPRLTVGLPVYNGEKYLAESLDSLLGQTFEDFELIISDNASTDSTAEICRRYEKQDSRVRYFRQPRNIGSTPNHNFVAAQGRGEMFKWASHDDLYAPELLSRCVEALDEYPQVVLAHAWTAQIDSSGNITRAFEYPLDTASERAPERFRSMLFGQGGDDYYGIIRARTVRAIAPQDSYHHSDRTIVAEISLHGPFYQVPDWLYFRREHPVQVEVGWPERAWPNARARCANMDPRRADRWRHPGIRLYGEYVWGYVAAIQRAPLSAADRRECYCHLAHWLASRPQTLRSRDKQEASVTPGPTASVDLSTTEKERKAS
jgi:glycosyltransferase involved in cell wall biosynthesis